MNINEVKKVINSNTKNNEKSFVWNSINLAVYPLQFVCYEKMNTRVDEIVNKLAVEDMPRFLHIYMASNYKLFCYIMQDYINIIKENLRNYMSVNPKIIKDSLGVSLKIFEYILFFNKYRRHINDNINSLVTTLYTITNNELIRLNDVYHR